MLPHLTINTLNTLNSCKIKYTTRTFCEAAILQPTVITFSMRYLKNLDVEVVNSYTDKEKFLIISYELRILRH